jgi:hypothetical protein
VPVASWHAKPLQIYLFCACVMWQTSFLGMKERQLSDYPRLRHMRAPEHALPYRVMFEELFAIGKANESFGSKSFEDLVDEAFTRASDTSQTNVIVNRTDEPDDGSQTKPPNISQQIFDRILQVEQAYEELADEKSRREYSTSKETAIAKLEKPLLELLHLVPRTALCLSGGGIRSAAYCLGVLQALARFRGAANRPRYEDPNVISALEQFDYLSTVSGGGYIGSWLTAWTHREREASVKSALGQEANRERSGAQNDSRILEKPLTPGQAFHRVSRAVAGDVSHTSADPAQRPIRHLREYTSFLAPKLGLSLDTWTLGAVVLRNLLVNWVMTLPVILTLVAALQTAHFGLFWLSNLLRTQAGYGWWIAVGGLFLLAGTTAARRMPSCPPADRATQSDGVLSVTIWFILPLIIASFLLLEFWLNLGNAWAGSWVALLQRLTLGGFLTFLSVPTIRLFRGRNVIELEHRPANYLIAGAAAALLTSLILASAVYAAGYASDLAVGGRQAVDGWHVAGAQINWSMCTRLFHWATFASDASSARGMEQLLARGTRKANVFAVFGFPAIWFLLIASSALFSGFIGIFEEDVDREWWGRAGGVMMSVLAAWIAGMGMVIIAPHLTSSIWRGTSLAVAALATGLTGALGGASTAGGIGAAAGKTANLTKVGQFLNKHSLLIPTLCGIALLVLGAFLADLELWIADAFGGGQATRIHLMIFLTALLLSLLVNWAININIFSLHGMYRMRLMRAFLGASNTQRVPNPFTGFDDRDTVYEHAIASGPGMPLHVINTTVNLVGTSNLAWQQRKAEGFTISPLHCGAWRLGYASTAIYGRKGGLSLSTAMAISGAAFNPNMGYHSSPLVTLVMTLFNVRLGWWLPNPRYRMGRWKTKYVSPVEPCVSDDQSPATGATGDARPRLEPLPTSFLEKKSPRLALGPLLREAFGATDDETAFLELSDGGHFENLGLYEMVLRRARWIVVIDASADPKCQLEDLGNAMRKVEIDLGVPIVFGPDVSHLKPGAKKDNLYCAVAQICYDVVDPVSSAVRGQLLYIKAGLNGTEPPDITQYARTHATFPHESTANQFFNEAQFESYRHLGHHAIRTILREGKGEEIAGKPPVANGTWPLVQALFGAAQAYTSPPQPSAVTTKAQPIGAEDMGAS